MNPVKSDEMPIGVEPVAREREEVSRRVFLAATNATDMHGHLLRIVQYAYARYGDNNRSRQLMEFLFLDFRWLIAYVTLTRFGVTASPRRKHWTSGNFGSLASNADNSNLASRRVCEPTDLNNSGRTVAKFGLYLRNELLWRILDARFNLYAKKFY